jgi:hypothetical protein
MKLLGELEAAVHVIVIVDFGPMTIRSATALDPGEHVS